MQPLLYALKGNGVGLEVSWEGKTVTLSSMAHADDLVLFIANNLQYGTADTILSLFARLAMRLCTLEKLSIFLQEKRHLRNGQNGMLKSKPNPR
jgi:hypothetical protein